MPLLALFVAVTVHELGHYLTARLFGIRVDKFSFGFGREILGFNSKSGTRWSLSIFPLGGYVKIFGDVHPDNPELWDEKNKCSRAFTEDEVKQSFYSKPIWKRMLVVFAGPAINVLFSICLLTGMFILQGERSSPAVINAVGVGTVSEKAGIRLGDEILEMDGVKVRRLEDVHDRTYVESDIVHHYKVRRGDEVLDIQFAPEKITFIDMSGVSRENGRTGMTRFDSLNFKEVLEFDGHDVQNKPDYARQLVLNNEKEDVLITARFREGQRDQFNIRFSKNIRNEHLKNQNDDHYDVFYLTDTKKKMFLLLSPYEAFLRSLKFISDTIEESYKLLQVVFKGKTQEKAVGGVGKISEYAGKSAKDGVYSFLVFVVVFSVSIGIINLLPIPVLDGGVLLFLLYELCTGRPLSRKFQDRAIIFGLVILLGIMIFANISDFLDYLSKFLTLKQ